MHDLSDFNKVLDIAIILAKSDGKKLPPRTELIDKSFLGTDNFFIISLSGLHIHQVRTRRIKAYLDSLEEVVHTSNDSNSLSHSAPTTSTSSDAENNKANTPNDAKQLYKITSKDFFCHTWLKRLKAQQRVHAIDYLLKLHNKLNEMLIGELLDKYDHCILAELDFSDTEQLAMELASREINGFYVRPQELYFYSKESADAFTLQLINILQILGLVDARSGDDHLNLRALNPELCDEYDYVSETQWLIEVYYSFYPKLVGPVNP